jgi:hypothetical protein
MLFVDSLTSTAYKTSGFRVSHSLSETNKTALRPLTDLEIRPWFVDAVFLPHPQTNTQSEYNSAQGKNHSHPTTSARKTDFKT